MRKYNENSTCIHPGCAEKVKPYPPSRKKHGFYARCHRHHMEYCQALRLGERKDNHGSEVCKVCPAYEKCEVKNSNTKAFKCPTCGKMDSCSPVRDGLCLDCFAKDYNKKKTVKVDVLQTAAAFNNMMPIPSGGKCNHATIEGE